jgi:hypothetical protein
MILKRIAFAAVTVGALMTLAGCETPESRIQAACIKNGVMGDGSNPSGQAQQSPAEVKRICECFTRNVKQSMTPAELKILADRMSSPKKEDNAMQSMPPEIAPKAMAAVKACAIT